MCSLILWGKKQTWSVFFSLIYIFTMLIMVVFCCFFGLAISLCQCQNSLFSVVLQLADVHHKHCISSSTENKPKRESLLELKVPYCNHVNFILFANNEYDLYISFKTPVNQFWCLRSRFRAMFAASRKKSFNFLILYFFNICFVNDCQLTGN